MYTNNCLMIQLYVQFPINRQLYVYYPINIQLYEK